MGRDFSTFGRALAAPARSAMLNVLMDGSARPAAELAHAGGVSQSAASEHLAVLLGAGLVTMTSVGRQRLYELADRSAAVLEQLGHLCPPTAITSLRQSSQRRAVTRARLCYDHLAGRLGVGVTVAFTNSGWLTTPDLHLTDAGRDGLTDLEPPLLDLSKQRRPLTLSCPDWTERRPHLAGALGAAVARHALEHQWVERRPGGRGLDITPTGERRLLVDWGVDLTDVQTSV